MHTDTRAHTAHTRSHGTHTCTHTAQPKSPPSPEVKPLGSCRSLREKKVPAEGESRGVWGRGLGGRCDLRREEDWLLGMKFLLIFIFTESDEMRVFSRGRKSTGWLEWLLFSEKMQGVVPGLEGLGPQQRARQLSIAR